MSTRIYLAVDNDGTEKMSNSPLIRLNKVTTDKKITFKDEPTIIEKWEKQHKYY